MLLQTLSTMIVLLLLAGGLFASALLSAKVTFHRTMTRQVQLSLARGTDDFTRYAADYVYKNHANASWPSSWQSLAPQPVCPSSGDVVSPPQGDCTLAETTSYRVTGSTAATVANGANGVVGSAQDVANNLQTAVDEQRISAEVTSTITNSDGTVLGSGTRELTVRIFDVPPWAIVTGTRDLSSVLGSIHAAEGDTGGVHRAGAELGLSHQPDLNNPSLYKDTAISVKMTCANTVANSDETDAHKDNHAPGNNFMPWGVQNASGAFESPCAPKYGLSSSNVGPADANMPNDSNYEVGSFSKPKRWSNGLSADMTSWTQ